MTTGEQGSFFTHTQFVDTTWQNINLYYKDDDLIRETDSGDKKSIGDQGIIFTHQPNDSANLELGYTAYFLPKYFARNDAEQLAYFVENPIRATLRAIEFPTGVNSKDGLFNPDKYVLFQNYPNPFNNSTNIKFHLPQKEAVSIKIVDIAGRTVTNLANKSFDKGIHVVQWTGLKNNLSEIPSGIYFIVFESENFSDVTKSILMK